jgi:hypothetical protein
MHGLSDEMVKNDILPEIRLNNPRDFGFITSDFDIHNPCSIKTLIQNK